MARPSVAQHEGLVLLDNKCHVLCDPFIVYKRICNSFMTVATNTMFYRYFCMNVVELDIVIVINCCLSAFHHLQKLLSSMLMSIFGPT